MDKYAVIVAGGSGSRMNSSTPKQFMKLGKLPVLMHTIMQFANSANDLQIVLVLPADEFVTWENLIEEYSFQIPHKLVAGGVTRVDSVRNGLNDIPNGTLVAIHDGVRPLVSQQLIQLCYAKAQAHGSGVAAIPSKDSLRKIKDEQNHNVTRSDYRLMQTPQTFKTDVIKAAFDNYRGDSATDDATIAEKNGHDIQLVDGEYTNIKITTPEDLIIAQALLQSTLVPS